MRNRRQFRRQVLMPVKPEHLLDAHEAASMLAIDVMRFLAEVDMKWLPQPCSRGQRNALGKWIPRPLWSAFELAEHGAVRAFGQAARDMAPSPPPIRRQPTLYETDAAN